MGNASSQIFGEIDKARLEDKQFLDTLDLCLADLTNGTWNELPVALTSVISRYFVRQTDITARTIQQWTEHPGSFFNPAFTHDPALQLYHAVAELMLRPQLDAVNVVKRQVYLVLFCITKEAFNAIHRKGKFDTFALYLLEKSKSGADDAAQVKENCTNWCSFGKRYRELASLAGGNGVLLVPSTICRSTIEKKGKVGDIADTLKLQVCKKVEDWECEKAAEGLFTYYTGMMQPWLQQLGWSPEDKKRKHAVLSLVPPQLTAEAGQGRDREEGVVLRG
ncbi:hypothetical protein QBC36DRAFT_305816, partial [Triangularia setosa]